jgi:hypothetical protein
MKKLLSSYFLLWNSFELNSIFLYFNRISSSSNPHHRSPSRQSSCSSKKQDRQSLTRNRAFGDTVVDSFLVSSASSNIPQTSIGISRQGIQKRKKTKLIKRLH